jgi:hypothetical protein
MVANFKEIKNTSERRIFWVEQNIRTDISEEIYPYPTAWKCREWHFQIRVGFSVERNIATHNLLTTNQESNTQLHCCVAVLFRPYE